MQEWKVTANIIGVKRFYAVYRIKDPNVPLHSGNMEFATGYIEDITEAEKIAENLNKGELQHL